MGILDLPIFGTPKGHKAAKQSDDAIVKAPEFDVTQYAKKLAVVIGVIAPATAGALKLLKVNQITPGIAAAALGVTAAALLAASLVMAVDIAARAYLTRGQPATGGGGDDGGGSPKQDTAIIATAKGSVAWLEGSEEPRPILAIRTERDGTNSYLLAAGSTVERTRNGKPVKAIDGAAKWHAEADVRAIRPGGWP